MVIFHRTSPFIAVPYFVYRFRTGPESGERRFPAINCEAGAGQAFPLRCSDQQLRIPGTPPSLDTRSSVAVRRVWRSGVLKFLFNEFFTPGRRPGPVFGHPPQVATLVHDGWRIELTAVPQAQQVFKTIGESGGSAFTHLGRLLVSGLGRSRTLQLSVVRNPNERFERHDLQDWRVADAHLADRKRNGRGASIISGPDGIRTRHPHSIGETHDFKRDSLLGRAASLLPLQHDENCVRSLAGDGSGLVNPWQTPGSRFLKFRAVSGVTCDNSRVRLVRETATGISIEKK